MIKHLQRVSPQYTAAFPILADQKEQAITAKSAASKSNRNSSLSPQQSSPETNEPARRGIICGQTRFEVRCGKVSPAKIAPNKIVESEFLPSNSHTQCSVVAHKTAVWCEKQSHLKAHRNRLIVA